LIRIPLSHHVLILARIRPEEMFANLLKIGIKREKSQRSGNSLLIPSTSFRNFARPAAVRDQPMVAHRD